MSDVHILPTAPPFSFPERMLHLQNLFDQHGPAWRIASKAERDGDDADSLKMMSQYVVGLIKRGEDVESHLVRTAVYFVGSMMKEGRWADIPQAVLEWASDGVIAIGEGRNLTEAFSIAPVRGRPIGTVTHKHYDIALFCELKRRQGEKYDVTFIEAKDRFGLDERYLKQIIQDHPVPLEISTDLILDLVDNGVPDGRLE